MMFQVLDADNSGTLDRSEIAVLAQELGQEMSEEALDAAMREMDDDGSGGLICLSSSCGLSSSLGSRAATTKRCQCMTCASGLRRFTPQGLDRNTRRERSEI